MTSRHLLSAAEISEASRSGMDTRSLKKRGHFGGASELVFGFLILVLIGSFMAADQLLGVPISGAKDIVHPDWLALAAIGGAGAILYLGLAVLALRNQVAKLKKKHKKVVAQFERDALTGALNRERFVTATKSVLEVRGRKRFAALFLVDIDHFKQVNDTHGHPIGDRVLCFFAQQLEASFPDGWVGRLGGDEFAVFVEHSDPITEAFAQKRCSEFVERLAQGLDIGTQRLMVSASVGIAMAPRHGKTWGALVANADMALYASKKNGRAQSTMYAEAMLTDVRNEKTLMRELRAAILLKHLRVAYQPIVGVNGDLVAYEALLRWHHSLRGVITPDVFIPIAERAGLISDVGCYVVRQVCEDLEKLPKVSVNVNISANQVAAPDLVDRLLGILSETGVDPCRIVLEVTESASLICSADNAKRLSALQAHGFRIALDDFGMGYSEFNQLRMLPFDIIKIDKSFVNSLGNDVVTDVFVSAVVEISRRSGKSVIAEGIETEEDRLRALAAGCDCLQGFYFGKPEFLEDSGIKLLSKATAGEEPSAGAVT
ncbi:diguanylate cyclase (GGDEF) domain protein [Hoeflea phototrophica DFL-43]|uniref:Diguanylate cyclase (GGDEF) domain protein n=1 Tax=Hoeflea phototrophica (strain DSM 17068 / NCIMB 14078 / DFL-43) TaxID=411684 RepID=A9D2H4_HOEPD|nr:EAL domain-containing protein [Hoeflea phototrophica]EDQ34206.2 diguanylate cyclase (GGDEF) domain protein [Hoeflea phototrophica DFL-43]